jgi:RNA polymerase primary sigma factor
MSGTAPLDFNSLGQYLSEVRKSPHKLLTHEQEIDLFRKAEDGDEQVITVLMESNLRLVVQVARTHRSPLDLEDRIQNGNLGLRHAISKFDWRNGTKFSTYATWWIRQALYRCDNLQGRTIRLPTHVADKESKFNGAYHRLVGKLQREPTDSEVWTALGGKPPLADAALATRELISLDTPVNESADGEETLGDFIADPSVDLESDLMAAERSKALRAAMASLPAQQRDVLMFLLYGESDDPSRRLGLNMKEIGDRLGITREAVRQIIGKAMWKLRPMLISWDGERPQCTRLSPKPY